MKIIKNIKFYIKVLLGKELIFKPQIKMKTEWFGNEYGGFFLFTDSLNDKSIVYSFGIGEDVSFDEQVINRFHCKVWGFDPTPKTITFVKQKNIPSNFIFLPYGLYKNDGTIQFYLPDNPTYVSGSTINRWGDNQTKKAIDVPVKSFSTITEELGHSKIDVLKMDIESSEYEVLDDILNSNVQIDQILIEFHHRFKEIGTEKTKSAIQSLNNHGYKIIAISDTREEYTFYKL